MTSLILVSDSAIISGGFEYGDTIFSSFSIFLYKDLMLEGNKERHQLINMAHNISMCSILRER